MASKTEVRPDELLRVELLEEVDDVEVARSGVDVGAERRGRDGQLQRDLGERPQELRLHFGRRHPLVLILSWK